MDVGQGGCQMQSGMTILVKSLCRTTMKEIHTWQADPVTRRTRYQRRATGKRTDRAVRQREREPDTTSTKAHTSTVGRNLNTCIPLVTAAAVAGTLGL